MKLAPKHCIQAVCFSQTTTLANHSLWAISIDIRERKREGERERELELVRFRYFFRGSYGFLLISGKQVLGPT